ncbi:MAG: isoprenyl transferase [candidate division KSB1 bacterium]|nr:isoprenyl transferase [candidate division KSB1 bacterium]
MDTAVLLKSVKEHGNLPGHVAIIMDGNGRWAKQKNLPRTSGHREGIESVRSVVETAGELGIKAVTLYTFSSENWKRPASEVSALMSLLLKTINNEIPELKRQNVRLMTIGDFDSLPTAQRMAFRKAIKDLSNNTGLILNLALSYSGRQEVVSAVRKICESVREEKIDPKDIDQDLFSQYMQTVAIGDPDLLIRTSGEFRISNFLLWQIAYTEIYITQALWPDFRKHEFLLAIRDYQQRERRFGKVTEQMQPSD